MNLPARILLEVPAEPVISVDGASRASGLDLSHWPGHDTPLALRHDLSTGCALLFARLAGEERRRLAAGATAIVNNHYDTDGCLALFAVRHPARALPHVDALLRAARAGDFFRAPDEEALALDALVLGLSDVERSPLAGDLRGLDDVARWQVCLDHLLERLPAILQGDVVEYRELWEPVLAGYRRDRAALEEARREDVAGLDLSVWTSGDAGFAPGRHALFETSDADRVLTIAERDGGHAVRLVISTLSWFDLVTEVRPPRPDLTALAALLNRLEGTAPEEDVAWRAQPLQNASPELWFGRMEAEAFAERNPALAPTSLDPARVRTEIERALS